MTDELAVVTGATGGVGRALCETLARNGVSVLALGRNRDSLRRAHEDGHGRVDGYPIDLTDPSHYPELVEAIKERGPVSYLVHSAAIIEPIAQIDRLDPKAFRRAYAVNVEAPLFLTQSLLKERLLPPGARILHLSSGAAHTPLAGCLAYCSSKAAFHMIYRVLQLELSERGILVGSASPGSVDTEMQRTLRESDPRELLAVDRFRDLERDNALVSPDRAAYFLTWLLRECADARFVERDWNIADPELKREWDEPAS